MWTICCQVLECLLDYSSGTINPSRSLFSSSSAVDTNSLLSDSGDGVFCPSLRPTKGSVKARIFFNTLGTYVTAVSLRFDDDFGEHQDVFLHK